MLQIYRGTPMLKCDFNKVTNNMTWVFSCKFAVNFPKNTFGGLLLNIAFPLIPSEQFLKDIAQTYTFLTFEPRKN